MLHHAAFPRDRNLSFWKANLGIWSMPCKSKLSAARTKTRIQAQLFGVLMINPDFHEFTLNVAAIEQVTENHLHSKKSFMMFVKQIKFTIVYWVYCLWKIEVIKCFSIKLTTISQPLNPVDMTCHAAPLSDWKVMKASCDSLWFIVIHCDSLWFIVIHCGSWDAHFANVKLRTAKHDGSDRNSFQLLRVIH